MKLNTSLRQSQNQFLAPALQQSIEILVLPLAELNASIDQELQENPLLEVDEEKREVLEEEQKDELLKALEHSKHTHTSSSGDMTSDDENLETQPVAMEISLEERLLQQLRMELSDPREIAIGEFIIGSLNEDGYLCASCEEIALATGVTDHAIIEYILKIIQNFEPVGIASRSLKECLLAQVYLRHNGNSYLAAQIIEHYLEDLGRKKYLEIARRTGSSLEDVKDAARMISLLEPKPARNFAAVNANLYVKPDAFITKDEDGQYHVHVNRQGCLPLRVNAHYQKMLNKAGLSSHEKSFIREKLKNALYFIKSIEQRGNTLQRITEYILNNQKDFFEQGPTALTPMTLKDVAATIDRNESTVSRTVMNKYVETPRGLYPLKFFFSQGVSENGSGTVASRSVKEEIKGLIESEDKTSPLSDQEIQGYFKNKNVNIARRTISKYRQTMRILPSHLRKS